MTAHHAHQYRPEAPWRRAGLVVSMLFLTTGTLQSQQGSTPVPSTNGTAESQIPSYPNSTKGLENLAKDMLKLAENGDWTRFDAYTKSLAIPEPPKWFVSTFGDEVGPQLAGASEHRRSNISSEARVVLTAMLRDKRKQVRAIRFDDSCNDLATDKEYPVLAIREHAEPLFDVRFSNGTNVGVWGLFAYVDGGFRFLGDLFQSLPLHYPHIKGYPPEGPPRGSDSTSESGFIRVPGSVQRARIISQPIPVYPTDQKLRREQGNVILHAVIGKDGTVRELRLVEGSCAFAKASIAAVKNWRYDPTRLNGEPVEVDTTITVQYTLGRK